MFPRRDPELLSQYLCRFCGERIWLDEIVRVLRVDPAPSQASLPASFCWISRPLFVFLHAPSAHREIGSFVVLQGANR
jgi:hypothetical protein